MQRYVQASIICQFVYQMFLIASALTLLKNPYKRKKKKKENNEVTMDWVSNI